MKLFRALLYAKTLETFDEQFEILLNDETATKYPNFLHHINRHYIPRKHRWALHVRLEMQLPTHSNNTTNFVESSFRTLKDNVFNRTKVSSNNIVVNLINH